MLRILGIEHVPRGPSCGTRLCLLTLSMYARPFLQVTLEPLGVEHVPRNHSKEQAQVF